MDLTDAIITRTDRMMFGILDTYRVCKSELQAGQIDTTPCERYEATSGKEFMTVIRIYKWRKGDFVPNTGTHAIRRIEISINKCGWFLRKREIGVTAYYSKEVPKFFRSTRLKTLDKKFCGYVTISPEDIKEDGERVANFVTEAFEKYDNKLRTATQWLVALRPSFKNT